MDANTIKRVGARATRNRTFRRRLPRDMGSARFYASTEGGLKYLKRDAGKIDTSLTRFAQDYIKPGDTVWDIGANVGLFTFAAAGLAGPSGHVLALEPDPWLAALLHRSTRLNTNIASVDIICAAASDSRQLSRFQVANQSRACNALDGLGNSTMGGVREVLTVPTLTLDDLLESAVAPSILKVDTEGAETRILKGARTMLSDVRPTLLIEVNEQNRVAVQDFMRQFMYTMLDAETGDSISTPSFNTICIPDTRLPSNKAIIARR
jgi:FkbM family methyltransferase